MHLAPSGTSVCSDYGRRMYPSVQNGRMLSNVDQRPYHNSSGETPRSRKEVMHRFDMLHAYFIASAQRRSLLPYITPRSRATALSRRSFSARSTTPLYRGVYGGVDSRLISYSVRRDWNCPPYPPPPSVRMMPTFRPAVVISASIILLNVFVASLVCLNNRINLNRVQSSTHSMANMSPPKDVSWKGPEMSTKPVLRAYPPGSRQISVRCIFTLWTRSSVYMDSRSCLIVRLPYEPFPA